MLLSIMLSSNVSFLIFFFLGQRYSGPRPFICCSCPGQECKAISVPDNNRERKCLVSGGPGLSGPAAPGGS